MTAHQRRGGVRWGHVSRALVIKVYGPKWCVFLPGRTDTHKFPTYAQAHAFLAHVGAL